MKTMYICGAMVIGASLFGRHCDDIDSALGSDIHLLS